MVRTNKIISSLLLLTSVICISVLPMNAKAAEQQVYDNAVIFDSSEIKRISEYIDSVESYTGWDIMAVTTEDTNGKYIHSYSDDFFESHSDAYSGVACVMDMESRTMHISTFGEAITYLTDARLDEILDFAYEDGYGDYAEIMYNMVYGIEMMYEEGVPTGSGTTTTRKQGLEFKDILISLIASLAIGIGVPISIIGKYKMHWGLPKYSVRDNSQLNLRERSDVLIDKDTTSRRIQSSSSSSGGSRSSGSSTHRTSSGRTSGGRSRSF